MGLNHAPGSNRDLIVLALERDDFRLLDDLFSGASAALFFRLRPFVHGRPAKVESKPKDGQGKKESKKQAHCVVILRDLGPYFHRRKRIFFGKVKERGISGPLDHVFGVFTAGPLSLSLLRRMPDYSFEISARGQGYPNVAGIDEAGRGPLAGPVSAAAVILPEGLEIPGLNDSKKLSEKVRERIFKELMDLPSIQWGHSFAEAAEIDEINILQATHAAMARAVGQLPKADYALIDGRPVKDFPLPSEGIVKGDGKSLSIAAASVIAKVMRDRLMVDWDRKYPEYGFAKHKGYGTKMHLDALRTHGPCPLHRLSFAPVASAARGIGKG